MTFTSILIMDHNPFLLILQLLYVSLLGLPSNNTWLAIGVLALRIAAFGLLLRTYIMPWLLSTFSRQFRVRSVSLRSIRGIFIRVGRKTLRIDRLGYSYSTEGGQLVITVDGFSMEFHQPDSKEGQRDQNFRRTWVGRVFSVLKSFFVHLSSLSLGLVGPALRPVLRVLAVALLQIAIRHLPRITKALSFQIPRPIATLTGNPGAQVVSEQAELHASIEFRTQSESLSDIGPRYSELRRPKPSHRNDGHRGVAAWKTRLSNGFFKAWDRVLDKTEVTAEFNLQVSGLRTYMDSEEFGVDALLVPGVLEVTSRFNLNPKSGRVLDRSFNASISCNDIIVDVGEMQALLDLLRAHRRPRHNMETALQRPLYSFSPLSSPSVAPASSGKSPSFFFSPKTPASPFLGALSASILPRHHPPRLKLRNAPAQGSLSFLDSFDVKIGSVRVQPVGSEPGNYHSVVRNVQFNGGISKVEKNLMHRQWLGRRESTERLDSPVYSASLTVAEIALERYSGEQRQGLFRIARTDIAVLCTQWPAPWLVPSLFLGGDPNGPLLVASIAIDGVHFTERMEYLSSLLDQMQSRPKHQSAALAESTAVPSIPLPRLELLARCGSVSGSVLAESSQGITKGFDLCTGGFASSWTSRYSVRAPESPTSMSFPFFDSLPLQMTFAASFVHHPVFIRLSSDQCRPLISAPHDDGFTKSTPLNSPCLFSLETMDVLCHGEVLADIKDDTQNMPCLDLTSVVADITISSDVVCVELWHREVIDTVSLLLTRLPLSKTQESASSRRIVDRVPEGISASIRIQRAVAFLTSLDINPADTMDLSRGVALRCRALTFTLCSFRDFGDSVIMNEFNSCAAKREGLGLEEEHLAKVLSRIQQSPSGASRSLHLHISAGEASARSAVATAYEPDDPLLVEKDNPSFIGAEFLRLSPICFVAEATGERQSAVEALLATLDVTHIVLRYRLDHVYSALLASSTVRTIGQGRRAAAKSPTSQQQRQFTFHMKVDAIQAICMFTQERLVLRVDDLRSDFAPGAPARLRWRRVIGRVPSLRDSSWEELFSLCRGSVSSATAPQSSCIELDSARIQIPHGFVTANLIQDITASLKAARHLVRVTDQGQFAPVPAPASEAPKKIPSVQFKCAFLCIQFADDPMEVKLNNIYKVSLKAAKHRVEREKAFEAKVDAILTAAGLTPGSKARSDDMHRDYNFSPQHSVSIQEARLRLDQVHFSDYRSRLNALRQRNADIESSTARHFQTLVSIPDIVDCSSGSLSTPLFRALAEDVNFSVDRTSFSFSSLDDFLNEQGGLPRDTQYSLLIPMHITMSLSSLQATLRDYPIPMVDIPHDTDQISPVWQFDTDLVIAEEMGTPSSVEWIQCPVISQDRCGHSQPSLTLSVPKTLMPVKTYANPDIHVLTSRPSTVGWGVSYGATTQDLMRVVETFSHSPRDSSPVLGFWDKLRLIFHWSIRASFKGDVHYYMKGTRNPHIIHDEGAGFGLVWQGNTKFLIGRLNPDQELVQVISDKMLVVIPSFGMSHDDLWIDTTASNPRTNREPFQKICAKFCGGVRFGIGFKPERSCGPECPTCSGTAFVRKCRLFDFVPHYKVFLEKKREVPIVHSTDDSYGSFRSDFAHLSISLTSATRATKPGTQQPSSSLHLTPNAFAHFWSWWTLFDSVMSLPIRQGSYYQSRPRSPKFARHLATMKYRVTVPRLFLMHGYIDDTRETWGDGVTPWIGVKGMINEFQVDMHQRDQEITMLGPSPEKLKTIRRKAFYATELVMKGLDLRAILAVFSEPEKQSMSLDTPNHNSNYRRWGDLPDTDFSSPWHDLDDFVEVDWTGSSAVQQALHVLPVASCPHFTYFKRNSARTQPEAGRSKFGNEDTHRCLLGSEPSAPQIQVSLAMARIEELRHKERIHVMQNGSSSSGSSIKQSTDKMIMLLERYIVLMKDAAESSSQGPQSPVYNYQMPSDTITPDEWAEFDNVYHFHCPKLFLDNAIRDIMMQYYQSSRARRGFEYHMATRAVKFIRDQAKSTVNLPRPEHKKRAKSTAEAAAHALRKILLNDRSDPEEDEDESSTDKNELDPLNGWLEGVSLRKSHCCLLLKPQVVLQNRSEQKETCIISALQAKLQSFAIMDDSNSEDPISGKVMSRTYALLNGLQTFSPVDAASIQGDRYVPLEVLIDFRCESKDFERLVPQTDATLHYDKFNRLRLRNNVTSAVSRTSSDRSGFLHDNYLRDQTDLLQIHVPRFTVTASDQHFQTISHIVRKLLLFSDPAHKTRMEKLETLLFSYDFTDLSSAANVIEGLQARLRDLNESVRDAARWPHRNEDVLKMRAHAYLLSEELQFLFEAIKLAQDRLDDRTDQKSALLFNASSSQISWNMLDDDRDLLAKLVVSDIDYYWLSRQDSGTLNNLAVGNLQAFDGSRDAVWAEIVSKFEETTHHNTMYKRGLFLLANWSVLPPVGGIAIYESFELSLHPLRLQIDARIGRRIMEYLWPARKGRNAITDREKEGHADRPELLSRASLDSHRPQGVRDGSSANTRLQAPALRRLGTSRSFTDLRSTAQQNSTLYQQRNQSSEALQSEMGVSELGELPRSKSRAAARKSSAGKRKEGDAAEMRTRSSQKTFILVRISSLSLCLSIQKEDSFLCRDALIQTRDLEYRNQTWSFEELVDQFIPSDMSWKGWVKMAFHQPLVPVLPAARELFSKTKWLALPKGPPNEEGSHQQHVSRGTKLIINHNEDKSDQASVSDPDLIRAPSPIRGWKKTSGRKLHSPSPLVSGIPFTAEPDSFNHEEEQPSPPKSRSRMRSLFSRSSSRPTKSGSSTPIGSVSSEGSLAQLRSSSDQNLPR